METTDTIVIGAGVVGLACARALAQAGREVLILEAAEAFGTATSARSSEVIHAGIYYPQGSLKARLCVQGRHMLYGYCAQRGVPHRRCGKLIVAASAAQAGDLQAIAAQAAANGVEGLQWLSAAQAQALEPALACHAALLSPDTGIVDSHALMLALLGDAEQAGALLVTHTWVETLHAQPGGICVTTQDGTQLLARQAVNAAGLHAPALAARTQGLPARCVPQAFFAKGSYFSLSGRAPFSRLIYPVPEPGGLGVHLTLDMGGQARFGPDVQWVGRPDDYRVDPARGERFYAEVRRYWPGLPDGALQPGYAGMRPKISGPGQPAADFVIQGPQAHGLPGLVNLLGIESPGLTSCLALAQQVQRQLAQA